LLLLSVSSSMLFAAACAGMACTGNGHFEGSRNARQPHEAALALGLESQLSMATSRWTFAGLDAGRLDHQHLLERFTTNMTVPHYQVGEECYIRHSTAYPEMSGAKCKVVGTLKLRQCFNADGNFTQMVPSYKVEIDGVEYCAPQSMLRKRIVAGRWADCAWQPKREAR
jgi:hypothetical protein